MSGEAYNDHIRMEAVSHSPWGKTGVILIIALFITILLSTPVFAAKDFGQGTFKSLVKKGSTIYPAAVSGPLQIGGVKMPSGNTGVVGNSRITFDLMNDYGTYQDSYLDKASVNGTFRMTKIYSYGFMDLGNVPVAVYANNW